MHVPQSVEAATELREIAAVPKQLISPRLSKPLVSIVQDTLVGVNRLTRPTEFFTRRGKGSFRPELCDYQQRHDSTGCPGRRHL